MNSVKEIEVKSYIVPFYDKINIKNLDPNKMKSQTKMSYLLHWIQ